jgi:hypothetical protein
VFECPLAKAISKILSKSKAGFWRAGCCGRVKSEN